LTNDADRVLLGGGEPLPPSTAAVDSGTFV
jgi:hypothetical protein